MFKTAADTLLWQTLASVAIPGFTINRVVALSKSMLQSSSSAALQRFGPTAIGLGVNSAFVVRLDRRGWWMGWHTKCACVACAGPSTCGVGPEWRHTDTERASIGMPTAHSMWWPTAYRLQALSRSSSSRLTTLSRLSWTTRRGSGSRLKSETEVLAQPPPTCGATGARSSHGLPHRHTPLLSVE
jgi:hypothetical protein